MVHGMADSLFLSTPSARRATHQTGGRLCSKSISIHALREEGDRPSGLPLLLSVRFLSTPSARRATQTIGVQGLCFLISIHALREEGDYLQRLNTLPPDISIHALREEGDKNLRERFSKARGFLSTPSARRATYRLDGAGRSRDISIHALREEGDHEQINVHQVVYDFYPRPPRGGRLKSSAKTL